MNIECEFTSCGAALVESPGANVFSGDGYDGRVCLRFEAPGRGEALRAYMTPEEAMHLASLLLQAVDHYRS